MFTKTARYYDKIYSAKDYRAEVETLSKIIRENRKSHGSRLLDVACGTGKHLELLRQEFEVEGLDLSADLLEMARQRNPGMALHSGDMVDFDLGSRFDVVTYLFSSIGYVLNLDRLNRAVASMARHLAAGGLLVIEPWFTPETWMPGTVHAQFIDEPGLKVARVNTSYAEGRCSYFDLHYLIGTPEKTEHFVERHELGLFTTQEMKDAFTLAGLEVTYSPQGLTGRGLYIGIKPDFPSENVSIRAADIDDAQAICGVYLASRKTFLPYALPAHKDDEVCRYIREILLPRGSVLVAVLESEIVGMMALSKDERYGWIDQLYLRPDSVRKGIGTRLLEQAKIELVAPIRLYCFQANAEARRFYERHGFRAIEFSDGSGNEEKCPDVLYEWAS